MRTACEEGRFTLIASEPLLAEVADVAQRPRLRRSGITPEAANELLAFLARTATLVSVPGTARFCRDPKDDVLIETALAGSAAVIVSRDDDLTRVPELKETLAELGIRVLTVRRFLEELEPGKAVTPPTVG